MARELETIIGGVLKGAAQGLSEAQKQDFALRKEFYKSQIRQKILSKRNNNPSPSRVTEFTGEAPEGYQAGFDRYGRRILQRAPSPKTIIPKTLTPSQELRNIVDAAQLKLIRGASPDTLTEEEKLALEINKPALIPKFTPVQKSAQFQEPTWPGFFGKLQSATSPNVAQITPKAQSMIQSIRTKAHLDEFLNNVDTKIRQGSWTNDDKNSVLEYFGLRR